MYVARTGSYAAEIAEYAEAAGFQVKGLIEMVDPDRVGTIIHGYPVIGVTPPPYVDARVVVASVADRAALSETLTNYGWVTTTVVHPLTYVSPTVEIAEDCIVGPAAAISARTTLAAHALVGRGAILGHHVSIGVGAVISPGVNIAGNVQVGAGATIGIGATVINGLSIGEQATVAAGSVVVRDVASGMRVQGERAREYVAIDAAQ